MFLYGQVRLMMKAHSFVRENIARAMQHVKKQGFSFLSACQPCWQRKCCFCTVFQEKRGAEDFAITLSVVNRFLKFFHLWKWK